MTSNVARASSCSAELRVCPQIRTNKLPKLIIFGLSSSKAQQILQFDIQFAGHCLRSQEEIASILVLWTPRHGHKKPGQPPTTYVDVLGKDTGLTTGELETTMKDRSVWRLIIGVWPRSTYFVWWVSEWHSWMFTLANRARICICIFLFSPIRNFVLIFLGISYFFPSLYYDILTLKNAATQYCIYLNPSNISQT